MGRKSREKKERRERDESNKSIDSKMEEIKSIPIINEKNSLDDQFDRIFHILKVETEDEAVTNRKNIQKYFDFLIEKIKMPCIVTGIEDMGCFGWEERYNFGGGSEKEYSRLRKSKPSFRDKYSLLKFDDDITDGIYVAVQRISDKKKFFLPLEDLEAVDENSINYQLIHDYVVWYVNH